MERSKYFFIIFVMALQVLCSCGHLKTNPKAYRKNSPKKRQPAVVSIARNEDELIEEESSTPDPILSERDLLYFELSGAEFKNLSEEQLYAKALEQYSKADIKGLEAFKNVLLLKFPSSKKIDSLLYYEGMLAIENKNYGRSLDCFNKVLSQYPDSNKAVSAMYAKSIVYKKLNLVKEAESVLSEVALKYPGSPESLKASIELKTQSKRF